VIKEGAKVRVSTCATRGSASGRTLALSGRMPPAARCWVRGWSPWTSERVPGPLAGLPAQSPGRNPLTFLKSWSAAPCCGHHRRMSLAATAIIVSATSAVFTMSNMLISAATYRRGGPRVKLRAYRLPLNSHLAVTTGKKVYLKRVIHVHVVNKSASSIVVESVRLEPLYAWFERLANWMMVYGQPWGGDFREVEFIEGEEKKEIPPFGGARWILLEPEKKMPRPTSWVKVVHVRQPHITVTLTNGAEVRSNRVNSWRVQALVQAVEISSRRMRARKAGRIEPRPRRDVQLSFDDLQQSPKSQAETRYGC
jgi:hypothetical protein